MTKKNIDIAYKAEELLEYGIHHLNVREEDKIYLRNTLLHALRVEEPSNKKVNDIVIEQMETPDAILAPIVDYAVEAGLTTEEERQLYDSYIMGLITPLPSVVIDTFNALKAEKGVAAACDWLYGFSIKNNYIRWNDIQRNIKWTAPAKKADLEITINLSKPEKDNREIAKMRALPQAGYPKCLLCKENVGYAGRLNHPARETLRTVPVLLDGAAWQMQFSPYVYYDQHCIVFSEAHTPMVIDHSTFRKLTDFADQFPNYFIGSNACLPIVGGSILSHEHFQGGKHRMPMHNARMRTFYRSEAHPDVTLSILDWYNSVVHIESDTKESLVKAACLVYDKWFSYSDESVDVIAKTKEQHNAVTPIVRRVKDKYAIDMILRNNRTSEAYPDGIFHAHKEHHNIKKEGIGIIEVMGLFILPARLQREIGMAMEYLTGKKKFTAKVMQETQNPIYHHFGMIKSIIAKYSNELSEDDAKIVVEEYINETCTRILENTAVFKEDALGDAAFNLFLNSCGFTKI